MNGGILVAALLALVAIAAIAIARARKSRSVGPSQPLDPTEAEAWVRANITEIAEAQFPDNPGLEWRILQLEHRDGLLFAEVEPTPDEVGYPRFQFAFSRGSESEADHIATYCLEGDTYTLLSTSRKAPKMPGVLGQT
jgi:hypothetical protein